MMSSSPHVVIIVLNWNGKDDTLACLDSLQQVTYPSFETVVVDNGSSDGSVEAIRDRFPRQLVIEADDNLGYAGGNNVGLRHALAQGSDYALLLNNDTKVAPDFLSRLVKVTEADATTGIVGPTIYFYERPDLIWSAGGAIDWVRGKTSMIGLNQPDTGQFGVVPRPVDFVTGCALFAKRAMLEKIGLLDERFFAYYEETEYCVRAQRAGFRVLHVPAAKVWHKIPLDAREDSPAVHYYMTRNRLLFLKTTHAGMGAWLNTLLGEYLRTLLSWTFRPKWRAKKPQCKMMLRAIGDALLGRWGRMSISTGGES